MIQGKNPHFRIVPIRKHCFFVITTPSTNDSSSHRILATFLTALVSTAAPTKLPDIHTAIKGEVEGIVNTLGTAELCGDLVGATAVGVGGFHGAPVELMIIVVKGVDLIV